MLTKGTPKNIRTLCADSCLACLTIILLPEKYFYTLVVSYSFTEIFFSRHLFVGRNPDTTFRKLEVVLNKYWRIEARYFNAVSLLLGEYIFVGHRFPFTEKAWSILLIQAKYGIFVPFDAKARGSNLWYITHVTT